MSDKAGSTNFQIQIQGPAALQDFWGGVRSFSISAFASAVGATSVYPIDLAKTRLQNQRTLTNVQATELYKNSFDCMTKVARSEGFLGLYKGLIPNLIGQVPEKAVRLVVVEAVRGYCRKYQTTGGSDGPLSYYDVIWPEVIAGAVAGFNQVFIINPMEIIKVRMQVAGQEKSGNVGVIQSLRSLGVSGMYRGASACFLRDMPFSAVYFPVYAALKHAFSNRDSNPPTVIQLFTAGSIAGMIAAAISTPADVIKTRMQVKVREGEKAYKGLFDCLQRVVHEEGFKALLKGLGPRVLRSAPQYGVMLLAYEMLRRIFVPSEETKHIEPMEVGASIVEDRWRALHKWVPPPSFTEKARNFSRIAVGGQGHVWALGNLGTVFTWTGFEWKQIQGEVLDYISVGVDGAVWGIRNSKVLKWNPWQMSFKEIQTPSKMSKISVGRSGVVWAISKDGSLYRYNGSQEWDKKSERKVKHISVGADETLWAVDKDTEEVFRWKKSENQWENIKGPKMTTLSVGSKRSIWGVSQGQKLFRWEEDLKKWSEVKYASEGIANISAGADGVVLATPTQSDATKM